MRTAEDCQEYIKPGVNLKEVEEEFMSGCGCSPDHPAQCTDYKFEVIDGILTCVASDDCKLALQKISDMWKEGAITNPNCLLAFEVSRFANAMCNN